MPSLTASIEKVVNLVTQQVPNDNGAANFFYDRVTPFSVPPKFAFVITDIIVNPQITSVAGNEFYLVVLTIDAGRSFTIRSRGETRHLALSTGLVAPGPTIPSPGGVKELIVRNTTFSTGPVEVQLLGYFTKAGRELGVGMPFTG
jgi:hypothetical protein